MTDRRIVVVAEVLSDHAWERDIFGCDAWPDFKPALAIPEDLHDQHDQHVAIAVLAALDADARTRPFIGIVPPVRPLNERDTPGVYPGLDEFHKDTTHRPEA